MFETTKIAANSLESKTQRKIAESFYDWRVDLLKIKTPDATELVPSTANTNTSASITTKKGSFKNSEFMRTSLADTPSEEDDDKVVISPRSMNNNKNLEGVMTTKPLSQDVVKQVETALNGKLAQNIFPVRYNSRVYINQTALIYQLAKSRLVINRKPKQPLVRTNNSRGGGGGGMQDNRTTNKSELGNPNNRSVAKITVHVLQK